MPLTSVGIIGLGTVGGALEAFFRTTGRSIARYDTLKGIGSAAEVSQASVLFICVPTPFDAAIGFDVSAVETALKSIQGSKVVVIKSTVLPGTTLRLQGMFPQHQLLMSPEFLREVSAVEDTMHPDRQLVGYTAASRSVADEVLAVLPRAPYERVVPATAAELVKYFTNTFLATKVTLANEFYDLAQHFGVPYEALAEALGQDARIGPSHLKVNPSDRGYGGKCLPKDVSALAQLVGELGLDASVIQAVDEHNRRYRKQP